MRADAAAHAPTVFAVVQMHHVRLHWGLMQPYRQALLLVLLLVLLPGLLLVRHDNRRPHFVPWVQQGLMQPGLQRVLCLFSVRPLLPRP